MVEVTEAAASENCDTIIEALADPARIRATTDIAVLMAGKEVVGRCIGGEYVAPAAAPIARDKVFRTGSDWDIRHSGGGSSSGQTCTTTRRQRAKSKC